MSNYWLGVALLSAIAVGIVALPFLVKSHRRAQDELTNTQIIKQRMSELRREVSEGLITEHDKDIAINELKLALVDETRYTEDQKNGSGRVMLIGIPVSVILVAALYVGSNEVADIQHWQTVTAKSSELAKRIVVEADPTVTVDDIEDFALAMRTKLIATPDDHIGWLLLGRLHVSVNRLDSALQAFERAYQLAPDHPGVLSSFSQTLVMTGQEESLQQAVGLIERSIVANPEDVNAIGMLAVVYTQLGDKQQAIQNWQKLKQKLPQSDPMQQQVDQRIASLGTSNEQIAGSAILVTVTIEQELLDKLPKQATLFVFAQDASGEVRMPAAVVKQPLGKLPVTVELSDANAMMPTYTLSQLTDVRLVARISLDDNVAQSKGELQGETRVTLEQGKKLQQQLTIDKELM